VSGPWRALTNAWPLATTGRERRLGLRLLLAIVMTSTGLALVATCILLALDYRREVAAIDEELARVERSQLPSLANSLWSFDETQLRLQLNGILQSRDLPYVELIGKGGEVFRAGMRPTGEVLIREFTVRHSLADHPALGTLKVSVSLDGLYSRLKAKAFAILAATVLGTLVVGLIILALVGRWVTRHLEHMARYARSLNLEHLGEPLMLSRAAGEAPDELDHVANALNDMTRALGDELGRRAAIIKERERVEDELRHYRTHLEELVTQRTTELQRANDDLVSTNKRLEQAQTQLVHSEKMASIGVLAAGVAHEINNPIGFVSSNLGALSQYVQDLLKLIAVYEAAETAMAAAAPVHLDAILRSKKSIDLDYLRDDVCDLGRETAEGLARVKKIVQDLKDFSHVGESKWQMCDLHKGIDSTLNIARNEIKYKVEVIKEYGELPEIECLPSEINQVFMNLFVNAAHAIETRGEIRIRTGATEDGVWAEVSDTGKGIAPENLQRIFEPFFTTKPVGQGTGLGLALSYSIVQKLHGRLDVQSTPGVGTTFRISLALRQAEAEMT
jgi:signal transduction histidine kinase